MNQNIDTACQVIENLPNAYAKHRIVTDDEGNPTDYIFLQVNPAFEEATGLSKDAILGKKVTEVLPGIENSSFDWIGKYGKVALFDEEHRFEQFSDILQRWYEINVYSEEKGHFTTVFNDITDRKDKDEALLEKNQKIKLLLDASKNMAAQKDTTALAQVVVDSITGLTKLKSAAIYILQDEKLNLKATFPPLPPGFPESLKVAELSDHPHISKAISSRQPVIMQDSNKATLTEAEKEVVQQRQLRSILYVPLVYQDQSIGVLIPCSVEHIHDFSEDVVKICQTLASHAALAITETRLTEDQQRYIKEVEEKNRALKTAEKTALKNEKKVADVLKYTEDVSFITTDITPDKPRIIDFSPGAERMFGYKKEEVVGECVEILHIPEDVIKFPIVIKALLSNQAGFSGETTLVRKNGERFPAVFSTHPLFDEEDNVYATLGVSIDITERKQAEDRLAQTLEKYRRGFEGIVHSMGILIGTRDNYTAEHQARVAGLATAIADELGLDKKQIEGIKYAAEIHDIGKVAVPAEILSKPGQLSDLEYKFLQKHPETGYDILKNMDFPWPLAKIVLQHHEKIDGSGYPQGLSGNDIMQEAKVICVADVVEAMASHRPYRPAHSLDAALQEIAEKSDIFFDAKVVNACIKLFRRKNYTLE